MKNMFFISGEIDFRFISHGHHHNELIPFQGFYEINSPDLNVITSIVLQCDKTNYPDMIRYKRDDYDACYLLEQGTITKIQVIQKVEFD